MQLLLLIESGLINFSIACFLTMLAMKLVPDDTDSSLKQSEEMESDSIILKNKSLVIKQAYKDAGINGPLFIDYTKLISCKLNLISQNDFDKNKLNDKEIYLITDDHKNMENSSSSWDLYRKFSFLKEWVKYRLSFDKHSEPYTGELNHQQLACLKDKLLSQENSDILPRMANVYLPFSKKYMVEASGCIPTASDNLLYAIAGHEAMHAKYSHTLIKGVAFAESFYTSFNIIRYALTCFPQPAALSCAFIGAIYFMKKIYLPHIGTFISRQLEKHADIMAAKQLGVAKDLSDYLKFESKVIPSFVSDPSHPTYKERVDYLLPYAGRITLFKDSSIQTAVQNPEYRAKMIKI